MNRQSNRARLAFASLTLFALSPLARGYYVQDPISFWPVGNVEWQVHLIADGGNIPNPPLQDGSASWDDAFEVAITAWNDVLPDNVLTLSIVKGSSVVPGSGDSVNNVGFSNTVYGNAWGASTLGISISSWSGNKRVENDVLFNSTKQWNAYTGNLQGGTADFRRVAMHELGHSLGLDHPDEYGQAVTAIMNSTSSNVDALAQDDIDGVLSLYSAVMPVVITQQPQSVSAPAGESAAFSVEVTGSEDITYEWQQSTNGGVSFSAFGPTGNNFYYPSVSMGQNGTQYRVVVTNPAGSITSEVATLTVTAAASAPSFITQPGDAMVSEGGDATFTVAVDGSPTPTLQWQYSDDGGSNFQNVTEGGLGTGTTTTTLTVSSVSAGMNGYVFRCVATNSEASVNSESATLTVNGAAVAPVITTQPQSQTVTEGENVSFTVAASGEPTPSVQWQVSMNSGSTWSDLTNGLGGVTGATSTTLQIAAVATGLSGYQYHAVASNASGDATSDAATLTVNAGVAPAQVGTVGGSRSDFDAFSATWPAVAGATGYRIDVATDAGFTQFVSGYEDLDVGNVASYAVSGLAGGTYYYRVRAYNDFGTGASSSAATIEVGGRLVNLSTRGQTSTGANGMIAGFVVGGSQDKQLLIRAVGPTLGGFGVNNTVVDPRLRLQHLVNGVVVSEDVYDNWDSGDSALVNATASVGAFPLGSDSFDAAALVTVSPGSYTAQVETVTGDPGIAIVEVYETDSVGRLVNISTRGFVGEGDAIMIPGTVAGDGPKRLLVRAVGETIGLPPFSVGGVLEDPVLEVHSSAPNAPALFTNDDWGSNANASEIVTVSQSVGAFALGDGSKDAVLLITLDTGGYTFLVHGKDGATGVVIVELYEVP